MRKIVVGLILLFSLFVGMDAASAAVKKDGQLIIINKSNNQIAYYNNGAVVKTMKVATGRKPSYTPEGTFKVVNKIKNRPYYSKNIKGGDPRNPLGDRWLGLNARGTWGTTYAIHGNNNPKSIGTYASAGCIRMYDDQVKWLFDQVKVNTPVIITSSKSKFDSIATSNGYYVKSKIEKVTVNKTSPQPKDTQITVTAKSTNTATTHYKFSIYDGAKWTTVKNYSATSKATWKPTKAGTYKIKVQVKRKGSTKVDHEKTISYNVYTHATIKSVTVNKTSPQPINTTISVASSTNDPKNNLVKYLVYDGVSWKTIKDFSSSTKVNWKPTKAGVYTLKVQAKNKLSKKTFDHEKQITFNVSEPTKIKAVMLDKPSPQYINSNIKVSVSSVLTKDQLYEFMVYDGKKWTVVQPYSSVNYYNWVPKLPGTYNIKVSVKHKFSKQVDDHKIVNYTIGQPITFKGLTLSSNVLDINTPLTLTAMAEGGIALQYKFQLFNGTNWDTLNDFSESSTLIYTPAQPGEFKVRVLVKDKHSTKEFDVVGEQTFKVLDVISDDQPFEEESQSDS